MQVKSKEAYLWFHLEVVLDGHDEALAHDLSERAAVLEVALEDLLLQELPGGHVEGLVWPVEPAAVQPLLPVVVLPEFLDAHDVVVEALLPRLQVDKVADVICLLLEVHAVLAVFLGTEIVVERMRNDGKIGTLSENGTTAYGFDL